tara:strand:- start:681 stop:794 length:114 start_codon:yes stop_codon:yes gene_type:complete
MLNFAAEQFGSESAAQALEAEKIVTNNIRDFFNITIT